jgi:hypothetical protein
VESVRADGYAEFLSAVALGLDPLGDDGDRRRLGRHLNLVGRGLRARVVPFCDLQASPVAAIYDPAPGFQIYSVAKISDHLRKIRAHPKYTAFNDVFELVFVLHPEETKQ